MELLERLREAVPQGLKVAAVSDPGFGDCKQPIRCQFRLDRSIS